VALGSGMRESFTLGPSQELLPHPPRYVVARTKCSPGPNHVSAR
jgi:hypothetical protein